jgi:hypothetical protein
MRAMLAAVLGMTEGGMPLPRRRLRISRVADLPAYVNTITWRRRRLELERTKRRQARA